MEHNAIPYETPAALLMVLVRDELNRYRASIGRTEVLSTASLYRDESHVGE